MYVWLWRHLPGPLVARLLQLLVVFPWVEPHLPWNDVTVDGR